MGFIRQINNLPISGALSGEQCSFLGGALQRAQTMPALQLERYLVTVLSRMYTNISKNICIYIYI